MNFLASSGATSENIALATGKLMIRHVILRQRASSSTKLLKGAKKSPTFGANAPISEIPEPYKTAYDTLAKKTNNGINDARDKCEGTRMDN